jgi:diacylglycerol kinase family enzyme
VRRLLLIANPNAQGVSREQRDEAARTLGARFDVEAATTKAPGHAVELASRAAQNGVDLVVAFGGDGTVNEIANGLAGTTMPLGLLPGGGANVFLRSLGISEDVDAATRLLIDAADRLPRRVPLGRVDERHFVVNCGMGFDAAIVQRVESRQRAKKAAGDWYFVWQALRVLFGSYDRRHPAIEVAWGEGLAEQRDGLFLAIVQNTGPYTFLGSLGLKLCPDVDLDGALDLLAVDTLKVRSILPLVLSAFGSAKRVRTNRHALSLRDQRSISIRSERPLLVQCDGELVGERTEVQIASVPGALSVLC